VNAPRDGRAAPHGNGHGDAQAPGDAGGAGDARATGAADAALRRWVEACLGAPVEAIARRPLAASTSYACEFLDVVAGGGAGGGGVTHALFLKDYDRCRLPRTDPLGAQREVEAYRRLLDADALGTPRLVGARCAPRDERSSLLLEAVPGTRLSDHGLPAWRAAAAWLGTLQGHWTARAGDTAPGPLAVHDVPRLRATAARALREVAGLDRRLARRLRAALRGYDELLSVLADQPLTLVHGSYRPQNVLVHGEAAHRRVAPVDWEHVGLGCALHDLAFLTAGWPRAQVEPLRRSQAEAAAAHGLRLPSGDEAWGLVSVLHLHRLVRSLTRARLWAYERPTVERLIALVGEGARGIRADRAGRLRARGTRPASATAADAAGSHPAASHPAARAWRRLGRRDTVTDVRRLRGRFAGRRSRVVYRLELADGSTLVAKRSRRASLALEHHVYERLLPRLGVPAPRCLGWLDDEVGDDRDVAWNWLFLEEVGGARLDPADGDERACALRWLAALHAAGADLARDEALPSLDAGRLRALLHEARACLVARRARPALPLADGVLLDDVLDALECADAAWPEVGAACATMPTTLLHGDFRRKNLYPERRAGRLVLRPIDWEYAGQGPPALDLGSLLDDRATPDDLATYRDALAGAAWRPTLGRLEGWVRVGRALSALVAIRWSCPALSRAAGHKLRHNLRLYARSLRGAIGELAPR
jgi:aminoglycoside phosphotransferase (APT) family kinase protein